MRLSSILIFTLLSQWCNSQILAVSHKNLIDTTVRLVNFSHEEHRKENEPIVVIKDWGRIYDPVSINLLNPSNIDIIKTGQIRHGFKKVGSLIIYLKEGVKLISLKELFDRYDISKKYKKGVLIHIENQAMTRPNKLLFDPSQPFKIEIVKAFLNIRQYINISISK